MTTLDNYKIVLYRQSDGWWVAYTPAIDGCQALMPSKEEALHELQFVFEMIAAEYHQRNQALPADREIALA